MDRTLRAALVAALIGLVAVGGIAWFLGLPTTTSVVSGVVAAVLFGGLIVLAARRADELSPGSADVHPDGRVGQPDDRPDDPLAG